MNAIARQFRPVAAFGVRRLRPMNSICKTCPAACPCFSSRESYAWRGTLHTMTTSDFQRFMSHVEQGKTPSDCWNWKASKRKDGYGCFYHNGGSVSAHRVSYLHFKGDIGSAIVTHSCDNPACVNPEHLFLGTHKSNADERQARGRGNQPKGSAHFMKKFPEKTTKGEKHGMSRLSASDVLSIRERREHGEHIKSLADSFGISESYAYDIISRNNWKHI